MIKTEDMLTSISPSNSPLILSQTTHLTHANKAESNDYDDNFNDTMIGIDLAAEKKLLNASAAKMSSLDQIRACKDEKFLNIVILHKKFVDIGN